MPEQTVIEDRAHSRLSASSAHRWIACPGSIRLSEQAGPQAPSKYAAEGTAAHKLAEQCIALGMSAHDCIGDSITVDGENYEVDEEMAEAVQVYVDFAEAVAPAARQQAGEMTLELEKKFSLHNIHKDLGGTADCTVWYKDGTVIVADYKHGSGVVVEPENNPQLMIYAAGVMQTLTGTVGVQKVRIVVIQPRAAHPSGEVVRDWWVDGNRLADWALKTLKPAAQACDQPDAPLSAGEHCRFCPALGICPAHRDRALELARTDFETPRFPAPETLDPAHIAKVLVFSELMSEWVGQIKGYAQQQMEAGVDVPGFKLVRKRSVRKWIDEAQAEEELRKVLGDDAFEHKLLSPAKAEKATKKLGVSLDALMEKPDNGLVIASESDKRPAVRESAVLEFSESLDMFQ